MGADGGHEQAFQEKAGIRRDTLLREQRTYPFLDLTKRRRPQRKRLLNRRYLRPRHPNHGCPWIQTFPKSATVMLVSVREQVESNESFVIQVWWPDSRRVTDVDGEE